jgi:hypothetical protein
MNNRGGDSEREHVIILARDRPGNCELKQQNYGLRNKGERIRSKVNCSGYRVKEAEDKSIRVTGRGGP